MALGVTGHSAHAAAALWNNARRVHALRRAIRASRPDVVISFIDQVNVLVLLATRGTGLAVIVAERIDPHHFALSRVWERLRWWAYARAGRVVVQSDGAATYFRPRLGKRVVVIPNPLATLPLTPATRQATPGGPSVVAMGRLTEQKRFDLLLRAFARQKDRRWTLTILGEGPLRPSLEALSRELGVSDRVAMPGLVDNPSDYLAQASAFVLSSAYEGFPNALGEAMAAGLPVIATDCAGGVRELIRDGDNGVLVPPGDEPALAAAIERLMSDAALRHRLGDKAREVLERFGETSVMACWEELLRGLR